MIFEKDGNDWKIQLTEHEEIVFPFFGCGGTGEPKQREVGDAIGENSIYRFMLILGDMFYSKMGDDGLRSTDDERLISQFQVPYQNIDRDVKAFALPGNHEEGMHNTKRVPINAAKGVINWSLGFISSTLTQRASSYVDHYMPSGNALAGNFHHMEFQKVRRSDLGGPELHVSTTGYYKIDIYRENADIPELSIFMMDSNTFHQDQIQQQWFVDNFKKSRAKRNIIAQHHPWITHNKLFFSHNDASCYLEDLNSVLNHPIPMIREYFRSTKSRNYNDLYALTMKHLLIKHKLFNKLHLLFSAHAHLQAIGRINDHPLFSDVSLNHDIVQVVAGTGGGDLQRPHWLGHHPDHIADDYGYVDFTFDKATDSIYINFLSETNKPQAAFQIDASNHLSEHLNKSRGHVFYKEIRCCIETFIANLYRRDRNRDLNAELVQAIKDIQFFASSAQELSMLERKFKIEAAYNRFKAATEAKSNDHLSLGILVQPLIRRERSDFEMHVNNLIESAKGTYKDNLEHKKFKPLSGCIINYLIKADDEGHGEVCLNPDLNERLTEIFAKAQSKVIESDKDVEEIIQSINQSLLRLPNTDLSSKLDKVLEISHEEELAAFKGALSNLSQTFFYSDSHDSKEADPLTDSPTADLPALFSYTAGNNGENQL